MANKTIDQYSLSSSLNDEDLLLVAKYDSSTSKYTAYNKYKISALKNLIKSTAGASSGGSGSLNFNDYSQVLNASNEDLILIGRYDDLTESYSEIKSIKVENLKGAGKVEKDYVILQDDKGVEYRVYLAPNGNSIKVVKESNFEERELIETQNVNYHGLLVNMIYGAGSNLTKMPVSHNFIELYNLTNTELNLNGLHIHYKDTTTYTEWQTI